MQAGTRIRTVIKMSLLINIVVAVLMFIAISIFLTG